MLSHLKNMTCLEKLPAKFYISETQIAAVMLSLTVEANHNEAAFILGCYTPTPTLPHSLHSTSSLKMRWVSDAKDYMRITSEHETKPTVLIWASSLIFTQIHAFKKP